MSDFEDLGKRWQIASSGKTADEEFFRSVRLRLNAFTKLDAPPEKIIDALNAIIAAAKREAVEKNINTRPKDKNLLIATLGTFPWLALSLDKMLGDIDTFQDHPQASSMVEAVGLGIISCLLIKAIRTMAFKFEHPDNLLDILHERAQRALKREKGTEMPLMM